MKLLHRCDDGTFLFWCPGCEAMHGYDPKRWTFNGNMERPSFTPSLVNTYPDGKVCHLFLTDGTIHYCGDSYHALRGKSVPLTEEPPWPSIDEAEKEVTP